MKQFAICLLVAVVVSCGQAPTAPPPFLEETKTVQPAEDWNREVVCRNAGPVRFRVTSPGPISLILLSQAARDAAIQNDVVALKREGMILSADSDGPVYEHTLELTPGSYFLVIRNNLSRPADIRLECFDEGD
jgi:hypothetical protein